MQSLEKSVARWVEISSLAGIDTSEYNDQAAVIISELNTAVDAGSESVAIKSSTSTVGFAGSGGSGNVVSPAEIYISSASDPNGDDIADV